MKIYRRLWTDEAMLAPQQFQQQARWDAHVAEGMVAMFLANTRGVLHNEFDTAALAFSRLNACLRKSADFYLAVRSSLPNHLSQTQFPLLCKAGSYEGVSNVVNVALKGVGLNPLPPVPAAIPLCLENQYFALDLNSLAAQVMLEVGHRAFCTPAALGEVKLKRYVV